MRVIVAEPPNQNNVCIGISRSIESIRKAVSKRGKVFAFEPAHEMELRKSGKKLLAGVSSLEASMEDVHAHYPELQRVEMVDTLDAITDSFMVVSARGIPPSVMEEAKRRGMEVLNTTCPFVLSQENYATRLVKEGYDIVYCGAGAQHGVPRLRDIVERAGKRFWTAEHAEDVRDVPKLSKVGVMAQTTQSLENLQGVVNRVLEKCHEVKVVNSICGDAIARQAAARDVAEQVDVVIVIGESWGASRVAEVCRNANPRTYRAVTPADLRLEWFKGVETVGICPGNATPQFMVDRFVRHISEIPTSEKS